RDVEAGISELGGGGHVGERAGAPSRADRVNLEFARADVGEHVRNPGPARLHLARKDGCDERSAALIRDMEHVQAGARSEYRHGEVVHRAVSCRAIAEFPRLTLREENEVL